MGDLFLAKSPVFSGGSQKTNNLLLDVRDDAKLIWRGVRRGTDGLCTAAHSPGMKEKSDFFREAYQASPKKVRVKLVQGRYLVNTLTTKGRFKTHVHQQTFYDKSSTTNLTANMGARMFSDTFLLSLTNVLASVPAMTFEQGRSKLPGSPGGGGTRSIHDGGVRRIFLG